MDPLRIIEKYYKKETHLYNILVNHSELVKNKALEIAKRHPELHLDQQFIAEATMLHDIGIFKCNAPRIYCHGSSNYIEHGYLGSEILKAEGLPRHALVCERHTGTGISLEMILRNNLPLPHRDLLPITREEQVICYADKFFSKTKMDETLSLQHIRTTLRKFGESQVTQFDEWNRLFDDGTSA
ncbi:MAG: HDIG domain-containing protein [Bacteroidota bacterium]|nr:HDIG domain-containing protein [Bacteroidota bacterium]MDP4271808.1 HDIG domain-containing protein [Bacteroidota bacterium]